MGYQEMFSQTEEAMGHLFSKFFGLLFKLFFIGFLLGVVSGKIICDQLNTALKATPTTHDTSSVIRSEKE